MGLGRPIRKIFITDDFHYSEIDFELDSFIEFLDLTNEQIELKIKKYLNEYNGASEIDKEIIFDPIDVYIKQKNLQLYYSTIIISIYSFLEQSLLRLCRIAETNERIKIEDISGKGIFKFKKYLEKVSKIDFEEMNNEWKEITKLNHLRNVFVHSSNSRLKITETKTRINAIKEIKHIKVLGRSEYYKIEFNDDKSIRFFVRTIREFLNKIYTYKP
ncbi:hypothetical protein [Spongiivirga citrea]|uniref:RiboL-PSP-HEPN domain-containing protein n=1 Tax=Spongiivirga citrea TaxID=1481457 RepID=A0A6M0CNH0_9FLAO|nr:hypothetical protein [Spongiivirga citrea]NER17409.1 hypothetical protein [Spongiivirga citrea]